MRLIAIACALLLAATLAHAEAPDAQLAGVLREVRIDQKLDEQVPAGLVFTDETGKQVKLGDYFGKNPVILNLVYFECPMLCSQVTNGLVQSMRLLSLSAGQDFTVLTVSFDPRETAGLSMAKRAGYLKAYGREGGGDGWHFLTGDEDNIRKLTDAVGFRYVWDEKLKQFAHAAAIMLLTPQGKVSKYFYGIEFQARDLRLGIVEATDGKIGTLSDSVLLLCYHYDPQQGRYSMTVLGILRLAGIVTVLAVVTFMTVMLGREWRSRRLAARRAG
jgi:protein SCO1